MNVIYKNSELRFESTNDLAYVLRQIPSEFNHRKSTLPGSTKVRVSIEADGLYRKRLDPDFDLTDEREVATALRETLNLSEKEMSVTAIHIKERSISVRVTVELNYPSLGECTSEQILSAVRARLKAVQDAGLSIREPQPQD